LPDNKTLEKGEQIMAINDISLTSGMRTNLVSLQTTTELLNRTQDRLSSGKKVNTALDNALNFFTAKALNTRADELAGYKDGMSEAVQTIKAANAGISAIEGLIGQAKAVAATAKAGGTSGTGAISNITVDLVGITDGQTIYVGTKTFTAVATDGRLQKTIDFTGITVGNTVTIGNTTYTAKGAKDTITFRSTFAVGDTITIGANQYTAKGLYDTITFEDIAAGDTVTLGSTTYTAARTQYTIDFTLNTIAAGDTITVGGTTYVATGAATVIATEFLITGDAAADAAAFYAALGLSAATGSITGNIVTASVTTSAAGAASTTVGAKITIANRTLTATEFLITPGSDAANADALVAKAGAGTAANGGVITLSGSTMASTVSSSNGTRVAIGEHTNAGNEFTITYGATADNATAFVARVLALTSTTIGTAATGVITLSGNTTAGTVATANASITIATTTGSGTNDFIITIGADEANAGAFLSKAGTSIGATATGSSDVVLTTGTSALTVSESGGATIASATVALATTEFYIGVGSTSTSATDNMSAANLAAKINGFGEFGASVSSNRINLLTGTVTLTDGGAASTVTTDDNVTSTATSATNGFTVVINKSTTDRTTYAAQFNTIMAQLDLLATDSSYKGINFLETGSSLDVMFGTSASDKITLNGFDASATGLLAKTGSFLKTAENTWSTNAYVDVDIAALARATATLKAQASSMSSGLSIINTRQDFVKAMVNTVTQGADNLTLADMNEEGANMLMLQTRQSLSTTALSMSAQAAQSVLRLFA
jgi:flagellin-like hook-associated protein FlgL